MSSSASATGSDGRSGMASELVTTYYAGEGCRFSPTFLVFTPATQCDHGVSACNATDMDASFTTDCSTDRMAFTSGKFDESAFLLIEEHKDASCTEYVGSKGFLLVGVCQVTSEYTSIIGQIADDGTIIVLHYNDSILCAGDLFFNLTVSVNELEGHACTPKWSGLYFRPYSNLIASSESGSAVEWPSSATVNSSDGLGDSTVVSTVCVIAVVVLAAIAVLVRCAHRRRRRLHTSMDLGEAQFGNKGGLWTDDAIVASRIPHDMVVIKEMISCGAFGEVFVGFVDGRQVAVKMLPRGSRKDVAQVNAFLSEAKLMSSMDHHRIVQLVAVAWNSLSDLCVISEFMGGGDLRCLLDAFEKDPARIKGFDPDKMKIAIHTANALVYLHSLQPMVLHRDLKSKNILLSEHLDAKLADFGVSREHADMTMTAGVGTSLWMAPEVLMGERYDDKADVFSFGVVLAELDTHSLPYRHAKQSSTGVTLSETAILQMVSVGTLRVEFSKEVLPSIRALGLACVDMDPRARPTAAEVLYRLTRIARAELQIAIRP